MFMLTYLMYGVYIINNSCTITSDQENWIPAVNINFIFFQSVLEHQGNMYAYVRS